MHFNTPQLKVKATFCSSLTAFLWNIILVYLVYAVCRVVYLLENWSLLNEGLAELDIKSVIVGSLRFDTSAIVYTNILYMMLMLFPLHLKETKMWCKVCKWVFIVFNSIAIVMNLADAVYFQYTGRRTTFSVFSEFSNEGNLGSIFGVEILRHWYLVLLGIILIIALWRLYMNVEGKPTLHDRKDYAKYYAFNIATFVIMIFLSITGMRGGIGSAVRPITVSNANQYVNRPAEAALVLNTPFSMIRTIGKNVYSDPQYFPNTELDAIYTPIHQPDSVMTMKKKNVVILIVESFGREYIGAYNEGLDGGKYKGYAPFMDSLLQKSLSFDYTFCNGRKSIDGMPSILSSIPCFKEPFVLTPAAMNHVSGLAGELGKVGYYSAFFHGAENGSMGFQAFAKTSGYDDYFGRTEYDADKRFGGEKDFDGTWAIWDEPFLQFFATKMSEFKEPFITSIFTASSHHPFVVPEKYKKMYPEEGSNPIHKCIRYTDHALKEFFATASKQKWFKNTIFVFTSDHTNIPDHEEYKTDLGIFGSPILIYDPSGDIAPMRRHCIAQQIDIMPTILGYLGYPHPYVAFGQDLFHTPDEATWAVNNTNGIYQYVRGDYVIQFTDGGQLKAVYNYKKDWLMKHDLKNSNLPEAKEMEKELKAIIQSYMQRMINDKLVWEK